MIFPAAMQTKSISSRAAPGRDEQRPLRFPLAVCAVDGTAARMPMASSAATTTVTSSRSAISGAVRAGRIVSIPSNGAYR
jgi:hypothetical protein